MLNHHGMKPNSLFVLVFVFGVFVSVRAVSQPDTTTTRQPLPDHPRILLFAGEEAVVKRNIEADTIWKNLHKAILSESDRLLELAPVERIMTGRRLLSISREALRRLFFLSYAWRMTHEEKYLLRAEKEMLAVAAFTDWNPSHFLDVAEMTMAVSIGYDWLYNKLSPASRELIKNAIIQKGLNPSFDPKNNNWLRSENNWNQVCNAGITYGALAVYEDDPELSLLLINRAVGSIPVAMREYAPDGAYPEGYSYWGYGTSFNAMFLSAIEKLFKKDFELGAIPGFLKTGGYLENMTGPTGTPFNYSDAGIGGGLQPAMFWFASRLKDPSLLWVERDRLLKNDPENFIKDRLLPAILLWNAGIPTRDIPPPVSLLWVGHGTTPVALMRTSWTDIAAIFVGMKGGSPSVNHAHMDIGSFVMDADGVRWAMDLGMQDYESLESRGLQIFGRTQDAQRWTVFRYINQAHNTLTVNNRHQQVNGHAPIIASSADPSFMNAVTDMTTVYKGALIKAKRGIGIVNRQYVVIRDEIETTDTTTTIRWNLLTPAATKITGKNNIELSQNGKKLLLQVQSKADVVMKTWTTAPPNSYDAANPGTIMAGFEVTVPARTRTAITVKLIPEKAIRSATMRVPALEQWGQKRGLIK